MGLRCRPRARHPHPRSTEVIYKVGPSQGLDSDLWSPDGSPWCRYGSGPIVCLNGEACVNPHHGRRSRRSKAPAPTPGCSSAAEHLALNQASVGSSPTTRTARWMIWVSTPNATFALEVDETRKVVFAPPIARYTIGWDASKAKAYFRIRRADVQVIDVLPL